MFKILKKKKKPQHYKSKPKMEFSKKWLVTTFVLTGIVVVASFVCVIKSGELGVIDLSPITVICTSAFASLSVASLSYFRKAQAENVLKISKQIQEENIDVQNVEVANQIMNSDFHSSV